MNFDLIAGVDIGGTHITAALVNVRNGAILTHSLVRKTVRADDDADTVIKTWASAIRNAFSAYHTRIPQQLIGIAMPGPVDYESGISLIKDQGKYECLYGLNIKQLLAAELGIAPTSIRMMNDALCFLRGEIAGGAIQGCTSALGITLGTGLGSAWFSNGKVIDADLWRMPFEGVIAEDLLASRWFVQRYALQSGITVENTRALVDRLPKDPSIAEIFKEFAERLARFIEIALHKHPSDVIVVGGNISKSHRLFLPALEAALKQKNIEAPVRIALLGEDAHIIGAATCWM
ncbi:ROK family protein [Pseudoflavitalea sp. G-6-1-2]|uniref:ROK family protein n=1 Tax=Pseudoflavitalea sp. G-6-1-2 TaxID=2728841 RepID=UPI001469E998|nr:ROK family protein [Pseudoflavitalea sp. G-6-1-2]NML21142.1 ROK family protein [Pseudoflavitalea sp. G-6-1-2]